MLGKPFYGRLFFSPDGDGGAGGGPAGEGADGDGNDGDSQGNADRGEQDGKAEDVTGLKRSLSAERRQNADIRRFASERNITVAKAIELFTAAEDANKTELDRAATERDREKQRADAAELKVRTANAKVAVTDAATKAGAIDAVAVLAIVRDGLEYDDEGEPTNVDAAVVAAKKNHPALFRAAGGKGNGADRSQGDDREIQPGMDRLSHAYKTSSKTADRQR